MHQINLDGEVLADIERDALHRETSRSQGSLNSQFDYDPAGRLVRHRASAQRAVNAVLERAYAYDATGQLVARADSLRGRQDFKYDPVGRILSALPSALPPSLAGKAGVTSTHQSELFAFDPAGNLLPEAPQNSNNDGKNNSISGNEYAGYRQNSIIPDNRLRVYQDLAFEYDAHGNVTQRMRGNQAAGTHSDAAFSWNDDHQLVSATVARHGVTQTTRYAYDALGRRVAKADSFGATHYLWDGDLMVHSQRGSKEALFVFEPNSFVPLATVQGTKNDKQTYWYQCDQIGAPLELTDAQGHIVWAADYKVWGEAKVRQITLPQSYRTGTDDYSANDFTPKRGGTWKDAASSATASNAPPLIEQPFRFQGQQFDEETGLHYNRFRYYDPVIGRFVSQDPIGLAGGLNAASYAPNPLGFVDPRGLEVVSFKTAGSTLCIKNKFPAGSAESKELKEFTGRWNDQIKNNNGSMTRRVLTDQEKKDSEAWKRKARKECPCGKVAGHVPDAAAGGSAVPKDWMPQIPATNSYVGGIVSKLPVGYTYSSVKLVADLSGC